MINIFEQTWHYPSLLYQGSQSIVLWGKPGSETINTELIVLWDNWRIGAYKWAQSTICCVGSIFRAANVWVYNWLKGKEQGNDSADWNKWTPSLLGALKLQKVFFQGTTFPGFGRSLTTFLMRATWQRCQKVKAIYWPSEWPTLPRLFPQV